MSGVRRYQNKCKQIDVHEVLKKEIYAQGQDYEYQGTLNAATGIVSGAEGSSSRLGFRDVYMLFDSTNADGTSNRAAGQLKFNVTLLNNSNPLDGIIMVQPTEFFFPKPTNVLSTDPNFYFFRKVYMRIETLPQTQAVTAQKSFWFHFEFDVEDINAIAVKLIPTAETTSFFLRSPVNALSEFNCSFWVPNPVPSALSFKQIPLPPDVVQITGVPGTLPGRFTIGGNPALASSVLGTLGQLGVPPAPGIAAWITASSTGVPAQDTIINSPAGVYITNIAFSGVYYYFEIATVDLTAAVPFTGTMTIGKNRIAMTFRFTSLDPSSNTHVTVGHD